MDIKNLSIDTELYMTLFFSCVAIGVAYIPIVFKTVELKNKLDERRQVITIVAFIEPMIWQLGIALLFSVIVSFVDSLNKFNFNIGSTSGLISTFWKNDYYSLMDSAISSKESAYKIGIYTVGWLIQYFYVLLPIIVFFFMIHLFTKEVYEKLTIEEQQNNYSSSSLKWFYLAVSALGGILFFSMYDGFVSSMVLFTSGEYTPMGSVANSLEFLLENRF